MKVTARAAWAVGLLASFYAIAFGLLAAMVTIDVLVVRYAASVQALAILLSMTFVAFIVVVPAVFVSARPSLDELPGIAVTAEEQPALWARARELASAAGTEPPDEIRIDHKANASVSQDAALLGLVPRTRRLFLGAPLLLALSPAQLDAVLAHEFGHYSNHDTRLLPIVNRGRISVLRAVDAAAGRPREGSGAATGRALPGRYLIYRLFSAYAERYLAVTRSISRRQEFHADAISARVAGSQATIAALERMPELQSAYRFYLERFVAAGLNVGLVPEPPQVIAGFSTLLSALEQLPAANQGGERRTSARARFDSHPPLGDRTAALKSLPESHSTADEGGRAIDLLVGADDVLAAVGRHMIGVRYERASRADWDTIFDTVAREQSRAAARPLIDALHLITGIQGTLPAFLDLVDAGRLEDVLRRLLTPAQARYAGAGEVALELARKTLMTALPPWVLAELGDAGAIHWTRAGGAEAELDISPMLRTDLDGAYAALLAETPDTGPLRAVLQEARTSSH